MKHYNYDKELALKLLKREIEIEKNALKLFDEIGKTLLSFNGKVANKRLDTALKAIDNRLSFKIEYNSFRFIYAEYDNRYVTVGDKGAYITDCTVNILWATVSSVYGDQALDENQKIISDNLIKQLKAQQISIKSHIEIVEKQIKQIDDIISEFNSICEQIRSFNDKTDYLIRGYFDLKIDNVFSNWH